MDKIAVNFQKFHTNNPDIYSELVRLSRELVRAGYTNYGISALFEVVRYNKSISTIGDRFKLNNNYRALYARMIMERESDLATFFHIRRRLSS